MSMPIIKNSGIKRCDSITDIIESVALEQTALFHIINAEGEKLQKVIEKGNTNEMLIFNESVGTTINLISRLENILQGKLELFNKCLCNNCSYHLLELNIELNELDQIDTTTIVKENNIYKINLMKHFPRTITIKGNLDGTTITITAIGTLQTGITIVGNVITFADTIIAPINALFEVKLVNGPLRDIYTLNVVSQ